MKMIRTQTNEKRKLSFYFFIFLTLILNTISVFSQSTKTFIKNGDTLIVYSSVPNLQASAKYKIMVRSASTNNEWVECFAHYTYNRAAELPDINPVTGNKITTVVQHYQKFTSSWSQTYANIEMSNNAPIDVEISSINGFQIVNSNFYKAISLPSQKAFRTRVENNKVYFTIYNPAQITIDINGQMDDYNALINPLGAPMHTISLFANPVMKKPSMTDPGVVVVEPGVKPSSNLGTNTLLYFKPGVHDLGVNFKIYPGKKYYIPGDAIVYGTFNNVGVTGSGGLQAGENIKIYGYGTISGARISHPYYVVGALEDEYKSICIKDAYNTEVYGLSFADPAFHTVNLVTWEFRPVLSAKVTFARWAKVISWRANGDGIGSTAVIEDCFFHTADDCTYAKGDRKRCTYWKDSNAAVVHLAGAFTDFPMLIEDCDVIYNRSRGLAGSGVFVQRAAGEATQRTIDLTVRDIRVHDKRANMATFNLFSTDGTKIGSSFSGIKFENIDIMYPIVGTEKLKITGCVESPWYGGVSFKNVTSSGILMSNLNDWTTNQYVSNITFSSSTQQITVAVKNSVGGSVAGGGTFSHYALKTVTATPASGYAFQYWTENNKVVSESSSYTFNVSKARNLIAHFTQLPSNNNVTALTSWLSGTTNNKVAGTNRLMVVMVMGESTADLNATKVTYGSQTMTKQTEKMHTNGSRTYVAIFTLNEVGVNAASNGAISVTWNSTPSSGSSVYSVLLGNVDQTTPVNLTSNNSLDGTTISTTSALANATGDMIVMCGATANNNTITFNNGFTGQFEANAAWGDGVGASKIGTGSTQTPSFTQSSSGRMVLSAMVVKYASGSTPPPPPVCNGWSDANFSVTNTTKNYISNQIDISCATSVTLSMDITENTGLENEDVVRVTYIIDSNPEVTYWNQMNDFTSKAISIPNLSGSRLTVKVYVVTNDATETINVSNIKVTVNGLKSSILNNDKPSNEDNSQVIIYPNPVSSTLNINHFEGATIRIVNLQGQLIYNKKASGKYTGIDVSNLNTYGLVLVQVISGNSTKVQKTNITKL